MSVRAIVLGLLGASFICGFTHFNDRVIRQTFFVGSSLPPSVYGGLLVLVLVVSPLLALARKKWAFSGAEVATIIGLSLAACCIPSAGLFETFPDTVTMPHHEARIDPGWQSENIIDAVPSYMLTDVSKDPERVLDGYVQGAEKSGGTGAQAGVPWGAWAGPLLFWLPMVMLLWFALLGLGVVMHRQWSVHEQLPYPIATFASALLPPEEEGALPFYRQKLFWLGCGTILFIHAVNYLHVWVPIHLVRIPTKIQLRPLAALFPTIVDGGGEGIFSVRLFFAVIGLAFLIPKDVSFSLGIGPVIYCFVAGILAGYGVTMGGGGRYAPGLRDAMHAGAYFGMIAMIIYTGRRYYASVFRRAFGASGGDDVESYAVWGARVFLACASLFAILLIVAGLDWQLAIIFTLMVITIFVVIGRISAESGYVFIQAGWMPAVLIVGFMGDRAIGPTTALLMFLVSTVLLTDPREAIMPFTMNAFRLMDGRGVRVGRSAGLSAVALAIGLAVAVPVTLSIKYSRGTFLLSRWTTSVVPRASFDASIRMRQRMRAQGVLKEAESVSGFARLLRIAPKAKTVVGFSVALGLFVALAVLRLRIPGWPLHPLLLLLWSGGNSRRFVGSFLIGCLIKHLVIKYGGDKAYRKAKLVMIGLIAADMLTGIVTSAIGAIYFLITNTPPPRFVILVG